MQAQVNHYIIVKYVNKKTIYNKESQVPRKVSCSCVTSLFLIGFGEENANVGQQIRTQSEDNSQKLTRSFISSHRQV